MAHINSFNPVYQQNQSQSQPLVLTGSEISETALWEAMGVSEHAGQFEPRTGSLTPSFTPYNRTQAITIRVYDAVEPAWENVSEGVFFNGDVIALLLEEGVDGVFYGAAGEQSCPTGDCFIEAAATGPACSRSIGLSAAPHSYDWTSADFNYALNLGQSGEGSIWIGGVSMAGGFSANPGFTYQEGDIFRVAVETGNVCFRQNGRAIYRHTPETPPEDLQPIVSIYDTTGQFSETRFWQDSYGMAQAQMSVTATLPICQDKISEHEITEIAEVSEAESQRGRDKVVRYHQKQNKWDLVFSGRRLSELQQMQAFRDFHRLHVPFYINDTARGVDPYLLVVFETGIKDRLVQANLFDFSFTVKEY